MAITTRRKTLTKPDTYMMLVREFPLRPIKNDEEHRRAVELIGKRMGHDLDPAPATTSIH